MREAISFELIRGPYACPRVRVGQKIACEYKDRDRVVGGFTDAPIPWPYARQGGPRSLIVFGALARAVRVESEVAVAHHWGVSASVVSQWRSALGVPRDTPGTKRLDRHYYARLEAISKSPEGRKSKSRKMRKHVREGTHVPGDGRPFTAKEIALLGTASDRTVAKALGRSHKTIHWKRNALKIPPYRDPRRANPRPFTKRELAKLGTASDEVVARALGRHRSTVTLKRQSLGIPSYLARQGMEHRPFTKKEIARLGTAPDTAVAAALGRSAGSIRVKRVSLGIPPFRPMTPPRPFSKADIALLGTDTDRAIGTILGRDSKNVHWKRTQLGIPAYKKPAPGKVASPRKPKRKRSGQPRQAQRS